MGQRLPALLETKMDARIPAFNSATGHSDHKSREETETKKENTHPKFKTEKFTKEHLDLKPSKTQIARD